MKKRPLTPEELKESMILKQAFLNRKAAYGLSQKQLADELGITQSAVSQYLNGINALNVSSALRFSAALHLPVQTFSPRLAKEMESFSAIFEDPARYDVIYDGLEAKKAASANLEAVSELSPWEEGDPLEDDDVEVPYYAEVEFAGGDGMTEVIEVAGRKLRFSKETLRAAGVDARCAAVAKVKGNSMERLILDGAAIGFDTSDTTIQDGDIFAFNHGGMLRVKYLYRLPHGAVRISSENSPEYPDEVMSAEQWREQVRMLGRVFWWSTIRKSKRR